MPTTSLHDDPARPADTASGSPAANRPVGSIAGRSVCIDLEVGVADGRIHHCAAVDGASGAAVVHRAGLPLAGTLAGIDALGHGRDFLVGHNLLAFDAPRLAAVQPSLAILRLPRIDTLRLNPLAFPRNPYHHLVKDYQGGALARSVRNDPELDARLTLKLLDDQQQALVATAAESPALVAAWHALAAGDAAEDALARAGADAFFGAVRGGAACPDRDAALAAIAVVLAGRGCRTHAAELLASPRGHGWPLAYALAWLSVAGGNSVMPAWVRYRFPDAGRLVRRLRDAPCGEPGCDWCAERHDACSELRRWFPGVGDFRPEPRGADGVPLQRAIVESAMQGEAVLGILPTGTGKSLCYQIPALSRHDKTGALTVVVSPLVALMADQVAGLEARGIGSAAALNGLLSMPERADVLDRVRLGDVAILVVSPEQLRGRSLRNALAQREIGGWVLDEAHCLSKWGHDFRTDYRYVARYIRERAGEHEPLPPLLCLTATAKPEVVADIVDHFARRLKLSLRVFDGGASRTNLSFHVVPTDRPGKPAHVDQLLRVDLQPGGAGGAIVYRSSRAATEELAEALRSLGWAAGCFHAGLSPERKKDAQQRFIGGELQVMVATNAFGMGIDKPDVRLVIHADTPGSLENYLQEAGRAGRDRQAARCVLLYAGDDVERQFGLSARSRLTQREIQAVLKAVRRIDGRKRRDGGEIVVTAGELLAEERDGDFERDTATDDTRVRTAIAWLEEAALLAREENRVQVFASSLRVDSLEQAGQRLAAARLDDRDRRALLAIVDLLISARPDEGISTDELMLAARLEPLRLRRALAELDRLGIVGNDTALTAFVHAGVERSSGKRLESASALEAALLDELREAAPELAKNESSCLNLRLASQRLKDAGHAQALPATLGRILRGIAADGRGEAGGQGSLRLRTLDAESMQLTLQREWATLEALSRRRRAAAERLLEHLIGALPAGARGTDLLAETTLGRLLAAIESDLLLKAETKDPQRLLDRALLWLHEMEVLRLNRGLTVFRPAMTLRLAGRDDPAGRPRQFVKADFQPLELHYGEQVTQIHVMAEYAQRGLAAMADALRLAFDYFTLPRADFMLRWLPGREKELARQTTPESWRAIVESLGNRAQQEIVTDDRVRQPSLLVLAGPGAGKTRVLVHRIAWLVRVKREAPQGILALAYNRHAAVQIRRRLAALLGDDARGVTVLTCHALAMRLTGASFAGRAQQAGDDSFRQVLRDAVALLRGEGLPPDEADEQRTRLLAGFRWMLVDEYQDIGPEQYELIAALAGRRQQPERHAGPGGPGGEGASAGRRDCGLGDSRVDGDDGSGEGAGGHAASAFVPAAADDGRLSLFAVGDDDQNIYAFDGASVEFIRRFEADYGARKAFLTDNYRSTAHIVAASNAVIAPARGRIKAGHPIAVDPARRKEPPGGAWQRLDPVAQGRVQVLAPAPTALHQAQAVVAELQRLAALDAGWRWAGVAVVAREWSVLDPVRAACEEAGIAVQRADEAPPHFWRLRETQQLVEWVRTSADQAWQVRSSPPAQADRATLDDAPQAAFDAPGGPAPVTTDAQADAPGDALAGFDAAAARRWIASRRAEESRSRTGSYPGAPTPGTSAGAAPAVDAKAGDSPWWSLLDEAVAAYAVETDGAPLPAAHFLDWLAEWGREARRRQSGVLLLSAHRAKGLEFDHVVVLDGGWERAGRGEDADAPRRLYYVAMTRARRTLTLATLLADASGRPRNPFVAALPEAAVLHREPVALPPPAKALARRHRSLSLRDVVLSHAGRQHADAPLHCAIAALRTGDALTLRRDGERWNLVDAGGTVVGRLAQSHAVEPGFVCVSATVAALVRRLRSDDESEQAASLRCDAWEIVVPDLVFEPAR